MQEKDTLCENLSEFITWFPWNLPFLAKTRAEIIWVNHNCGLGTGQIA